MAIPESRLPGVGVGLGELERLQRQLASLAPFPQPSYDQYAQTIANQLQRIQAVGFEPPVAQVEQPASVLERIFRTLDAPGRFTRETLLPTIGIEGLQDVVEEGGLKGFLTAMLTDPLTYLSVGVGGLVKGVATQTPRLALRTGLPFLTRTAQITIPGTEPLARGWLNVMRGMGRLAEPALQPVRRALNVISAPLGASDAIRRRIQMVEEPLKRVARSTRRFHGDMVQILENMDALKQDIPDHVKVFSSMLQEDPRTARTLFGRSAEAVADSYAKIDNARQMIERYSAHLQLDPMLSGRIIARAAPMLRRMQVLAQRASRAKNPRAEMVYRTRIRQLQIEFKYMFETMTEGLTPDTQSRMALFVRTMLARISGTFLSDVPRVTSDLAFQVADIPPLNQLTAGQLRLAAAMVAEGGEGPVSKAIQAIVRKAADDPDALAVDFEWGKKIAKELDRLADTWQVLERAAGYDYEAISRYLHHLYRDHPDRIERVMRRAIETEAERVRRALGRRAYFTRQRVHRTLLDGLLRGLTPEWDPAVIAGTRHLMSLHSRAIKGLERVLRNLADDEMVVRKILRDSDIPEGWTKAQTLMPALRGLAVHPEIAHGLRQLDRQVFSAESMSRLFGIIPFYARLFKPFALSRPGYFLRTVLGETFNMILAGTPVWKIPMLVSRAVRVLGADPDRAADAFRAGFNEVVAMAGETPLTAGTLKEIFRQEGLYGFGFSGEISPVRVERDIQKLVREARGQYLTLREAIRTGRIGETRVFQRGTRRLAEGIESVFKMASFLDELDQGGNVLRAAERARRYHFDYGDVTKFEHGLRQGLVPFFVWTRKELPLLIESIYTRPQVYLALGYAHEAGLRSLEVDPEDLPDWVRGSLAFPTPGSLVEAMDRGVSILMDLPYRTPEGTVAFTTLGLPTELFAQMVDLPTTLRRFGVGMLSPLISAPLELAMGREAFTGGELPRREFATDPLFGAQVPQELAHLIQQIFLAPMPFLSLGQLASDPMALRSLGIDVPEGIEPETLPPRQPPPPWHPILRALGMSTLATPIDVERQRVINQMLEARRLTDFVSHLRRDLGVAVPTIDELQRGVIGFDPIRTMLRRLREMGVAVTG